jgi:hypothetical protein
MVSSDAAGIHTTIAARANDGVSYQPRWEL